MFIKKSKSKDEMQDRDQKERRKVEMWNVSI